MLARRAMLAKLLAACAIAGAAPAAAELHLAIAHYRW
jgi:hypothetical protein